MVNTNYPVGDFLIKVKNTAMAKNKTMTVTGNNEIFAIAEKLKKMGYFDEVKKDKKTLEITLTFKNKRPLLMNLKLISKPGLRIYMGVTEIEKKRGPSRYLLSTPKGILSTGEAIKQRVGGELIAEIW